MNTRQRRSMLLLIDPPRNVQSMGAQHRLTRHEMLVHQVVQFPQKAGHSQLQNQFGPAHRTPQVWVVDQLVVCGLGSDRHQLQLG